MFILRKLIILTTWSLLGLLILATFAMFLMVSNDPIVINSKKSEPEAFIAMKESIRQIVNELNSDKRRKVVTIKHEEVQEFFAASSQVIPSLEVNYNYSGSLLIVAGTVQLPSNPFGSYLNLSTEFHDQSNLLVGTTKIGRITLSNEFIFDSLIFVASNILDRDLAITIGQLLVRTNYSRENFSVEIDETIDTNLLIDRLKNNLKKIGGLFLHKDQYASVSHYYSFLLRLSQPLRELNIEISFLDYLAPLLNEANKQSSGNSAVGKNISAILAMGLFAGEYDLKSILKQVTGIEAVAFEPKIVLGGRRDLMKHFLYSAIIQLLGNSELSFSIGEFKEISDLDSGGSGFSFADLAADRAGVHFITLATENNSTAEQLQTFIMKSNSEASFFPDIVGLEEKLNLSKFDIKYGDINTAKYKSVVAQIDQRIFQLPLFNALR